MSTRKQVNVTILGGLGVLFSAIFITLFVIYLESGRDTDLSALFGIIIPVGIINILIISAIGFRIIKNRKEQKEVKNPIPSESFFVEIKRFFRRKRGKNPIESNLSSIPVSDRSFGRFGPGSNSSTEIENQLNISISNQETNNKIKLENFIIRQEIYEKNCGICKLNIDIKATVVQCPKCKSIFHYEHIDYWLQTAHNCPVCSYKF
ncbi:MAG: E3 ubiquitin protein ligase [Asgard group archaeon]|nr:E3 ubiquitin protein ligase [Asgard group archaeon]